mgnify:CR=1 FL=1
MLRVNWKNNKSILNENLLVLNNPGYLISFFFYDQ